MLATAAWHEDPEQSKFAKSPMPSPRDHQKHERAPVHQVVDQTHYHQDRVSVSAPPVPSETLKEAKQEHHEWALRMWSRMDRDNNGAITRKELDCEEFRDVLRLVLAPDSAHCNATYARSMTNQQQALHFCLRKADVNNDGWLSFKEFSALMWVLRQETHAEDTTKLVFALFDLDTDLHISEGEFREIYRFYLGHDPTSEEFWQEWHNLASEGQDLVSREQYTTWLRTSASQIFRQHSPAPVIHAATTADPMEATSHSLSTISMAESSRRQRRIPMDARGWPLVAKKNIHARGKWNQKWNTQINRNDVLPMGERNYFAKVQSLPALDRFYRTHIGFGEQHARLNAPTPPKELMVLSTDTQPVFNKSRHRPAGTMREHLHGSPCGDVALWEDFWQTPLRSKSRPNAGDRPVPAGAYLGSSHQHIGPMARMLNEKYG